MTKHDILRSENKDSIAQICPIKMNKIKQRKAGLTEKLKRNWKLKEIQWNSTHINEKQRRKVVTVWN